MCVGVRVAFGRRRSLLVPDFPNPITNNRTTAHCDTSVPKINAAGRIIVGRGERKRNQNISICTCKARSQASAERS